MHHKKSNIFFPRCSNINQKKLRIILCTALTIVLLFTLCSCSSGSSQTPNHSPNSSENPVHSPSSSENPVHSPNSSEVPEQLIKDVIDNEYGNKDYFYTAEHNMDNSTHIDTVTIEVVVIRQYHEEYIIGTCKYRYNKSNDTWDIHNQPTWKTDRIEYLAHKFTKTWDGNFQNSGGSYTANITSVDFTKGTITGRFSGSYTSLSLGGSQHKYTLDAEGTYPLEKDNEGYRLRITQSGCTYSFLLDPYYGFLGIVAMS